MTGLASWTSLSIVIGGGMLAAAGAFHLFVRSQPSGNDAMGRVSSAVIGGAGQLLREAAKLLGTGALPIVLLLGWQGSPTVSLAFAWGILLSVACCGQAYFGVGPAGARVAQGAREVGPRWALSLSLTAGSGATLGATALTSLGVGVLWFARGGDTAFSTLVGFSLGVSVSALLVRGGAGIYGRSADIGLELLARVEPDLPDKGPTNRAAVARDTGDLAGTGIGISLETMETLAGAAAAAVVLGGTVAGISPSQRFSAVAFPVAIVAAASLASLAGAASAFAAHHLPSFRSIRLANLGAPLMFLLAVLALGKGYGLPLSAFLSVVAGFACALGVGFATRGYASGRGVARVAGASQLGPSQNVMSGFALGLEATAIPVLIVAACLMAVGFFGGTYGMGLAALGAATAAGLASPLCIAGSIGGQAMRIAKASGLGTETLEAARLVEVEGDILATTGAGVRTGAWALGALAWVGAYVAAGSRTGLDLGHPKALVGILLGASIPFFVCASALTAVGDVALEIVSAVRRRVGKGLAGEPDCEVLAPAASVGPRKLIVPGLLALVTPVAVGFGIGAEALGGLLAGATGAGILLCLFLLNVGDAWRGTLRLVDGGALGGWGSAAHNAAAMGDTLGEPLKDAGVPTIWSVLRVLAAASVIVSPLLR